MLDNIFGRRPLRCVILAVCAYISALTTTKTIVAYCLLSGLSTVGTLMSTCKQRIFWIHSNPSCMIGFLLFKLLPRYTTINNILAVVSSCNA
ncbi:hypothetical protein BDB00DRAFT_820681 [Zychaea mexicana]|uniref:uncharacterized protein n=1 Tax=Zychaea mexicana TaxID=64656 RepID=UPI0022FF070E|nr:uncharacterized protein BDB00DRAFT_820681 [Zychaea mexicana]KAI9494054.1 hypothetical protein BDB00DRAFT_820681 [Zychaea mexicana]